MTELEIAEEKVFLDRLRKIGFFESYIQEMRQMAINRHKSTGYSYIKCLNEVYKEEMAQAVFGVVNNDDSVDIIEPEVN